MVSVQTQIETATDVSLATVVDAIPTPDGDVEYRFQVVQQFAGPHRTDFAVIGRSGQRYGKDTAFDGHTDPAFWAYGGGRVMNDSDCAIHPSFTLGSSYLVFLGPTATRRSYEKIDMVDGKINGDDRWLAYVQAGLRKRLGWTDNRRVAGLVGPAVANGEPDYERVGRFIYAFHRTGVSREELTGIEVSHAPPELAERARRLGEEFDRILKANATEPDEQIGAALREGAELGEVLRAWRASHKPA
jgi:hypothetical protein